MEMENSNHLKLVILELLLDAINFVMELYKVIYVKEGI